MNFRNPAYLESGSPHQCAAGETLRALGLFDHLADYQPVLVGTIPLGLDQPGSDLDIVCRASDLPAFAALVSGLYGDQAGFSIKQKEVSGMPAWIARFEAGGFPIEIFAQNTAVEQQNGYRHLCIEQRLLEAGGAPVREAVRRLMQAGYKTEPAFANCFALTGDPYQALLDLEPLDDTALQARVHRRRICGLCEN